MRDPSEKLSCGPPEPEARILHGADDAAIRTARRRSGSGKPDKAPDKAPRMLIVEDSPLIALDVAETMRALGFDVSAPVLTYDDAMAEIERNVPDYAIIDLRLGMDGTDVDEGVALPGESLLSVLSRKQCRCLVFSGDDEACRRIEGLYPRSAVVSKPAQPRKLAREIEKLRRLKPV